MSKQPDSFGDRMKAYEGVEAKRAFLPMLPIVARIDGRKFSKFTKPFVRPFDNRLADAMRRTTQSLVEKTHAAIGYTQSDEITLIFYAEDYNSQIFFNGRVQKLTSVLASMATAHFIRYLDHNIREGFTSPPPTYDKVYTLLDTCVPHFDARVWQVPTKTEAANSLLWRAQDARKNGISSACRSLYSAKAMHKMGQADMVKMMSDRGIDYNTEFDREDRLGSYWQRRKFEEELDAEVWEKIPLSQRATTPRRVTRSRVVPLEIEYFGDYTNREAIIFDGAEPQLKELNNE